MTLNCVPKSRQFLVEEVDHQCGALVLVNDEDQWKGSDLHFLLTGKTKVETDVLLKNNPKIGTEVVEALKKVGIGTENEKGIKNGTGNVLAEITAGRRKVRTMGEK